MSHRTQVYLDKNQYDFLKEQSKNQDKSMANLIRDWIDEKRRILFQKDGDKDTLFEIRGLFKSGQTDIAEKFDDYLYGDKNS